MKVKLVKSAEFATEIYQGTVLVDFFTPTCGPCRKMAPILEECTDFVKVIKVDASQDLDLTAKMEIRAVPTLVLFKDGTEVKRAVGLHTKLDIQKMVEEAL